MLILGLKTNQSGRFTELKNLGVIHEVGVRKCKVTGYKVTEWDVTNNLPKKSTESIRPANLKKCINYIILKMHEEGLVFIEENKLNNLLNNG